MCLVVVSMFLVQQIINILKEKVLEFFEGCKLWTQINAIHRVNNGDDPFRKEYMLLVTIIMVSLNIAIVYCQLFLNDSSESAILFQNPWLENVKWVKNHQGFKMF